MEKVNALFFLSEDVGDSVEDRLDSRPVVEAVGHAADTQSACRAAEIVSPLLCEAECQSVEGDEAQSAEDGDDPRDSVVDVFVLNVEDAVQSRRERLRCHHDDRDDIGELLDEFDSVHCCYVFEVCFRVALVRGAAFTGVAEP